jgi:hypothetical protein
MITDITEILLFGFIEHFEGEINIDKMQKYVTKKNLTTELSTVWHELITSLLHPQSKKK